MWGLFPFGRLLKESADLMQKAAPTSGGAGHDHSSKQAF